MIPDFKTYIGESIWRNISQRSEGIKTRKENKINVDDSLNMSDMYRYCYNNYEGVGDSHLSCSVATQFAGDKRLNIHSSINGFHYGILEVKYDKYEQNIEYYIVYFDTFENKSEVFKELKKLYKNYVIHKQNYGMHGEQMMMYIKPGKGMKMFNNTFTIKLLNKLIELMNKKYITQR